MIYNDNQRKSISEQAKGKIVESLEWDEVGKYWVMTFTDGSEVSFRSMAELSNTGDAPAREDRINS